MTVVLRKVRTSGPDNGHLIFDTTRHKTHAVICKAFDKSKLSIEGAMYNHARNLSLFINLKCILQRHRDGRPVFIPVSK